MYLPYEPLTLVEPQFECPHPPFQLATHPPQMMNPPPPALELCDLDECFSDTRVRLANITNQFADDSNLDEYIQAFGSILGIDVDVVDATADGVLSKQILHLVVQQVSTVNKY